MTSPCVSTWRRWCSSAPGDPARLELLRVWGLGIGAWSLESGLEWLNKVCHIVFMGLFCIVDSVFSDTGFLRLEVIVMVHTARGDLNIYKD